MYNIGDLVRWYEYYANDADILKDSGHGIVLEKKTYNLKHADKIYINYVIHRTRNNDTMLFESRELEKISIENKP
jgi:hypothetical protein